jgi:hypothetical protein
MTATPSYTRESEMYAPVISWFERTLKGLYPRTEIRVFDTSRFALSRFLEREGLHKSFPLYETYDIHVDVTAVLVPKNRAATLGFVECKLAQITLADLSQLLGYSRVALPVYSIILSPQGIGTALHYLLNSFGRLDVLDYDQRRRLKVATWNASKGDVDLPTLVPPGDYG